MPRIALYANRLVRLLVALLLIGSKGRFAEYGLQWPKGKSYVVAEIAWAAFFGVSMAIVDYFPQILARHALGDLPLTALKLAGSASKDFSSGSPRRSHFERLLQTFLMKRSCGRIRFLKFDMHVAGVIWRCCLRWHMYRISGSDRFELYLPLVAAVGRFARTTLETRNGA